MEFMIIETSKNGTILRINNVRIAEDVKENSPKIVTYLNNLSNRILSEKNMWKVCATCVLHDDNGAEIIQYTLSRYKIS